MTLGEEYAQEFVDRDGHRLGLQVYPEPAGRADAPMVVILPAMGVRAHYYRPFAAALREAGIGVLVADLRGTGSSTPAPDRTSRYGYADLAEDVGHILESSQPRLAGRRTLLLGHSLGGQAALLHLATGAPANVDGLALVAVGVPYWRSYPGRRRLAVLPYTQSINTVTTLLGVWPGWGFGGRQSRGVIRDWAYTARTGCFPMLRGVDSEAAVRRMRTPVLAVSVDDDQYTPHETLDHLCAKLTAAEVRREHYTAAQAGGRLDHFRWVRFSTALAGRIAAFIDDLPVRRHPMGPSAARDGWQG